MTRQHRCIPPRLPVPGSTLSMLPFHVWGFFARSYLFIHAGLLVFLLNFLLIGIDCSWTSRRWSLSINHVFFLGSLFPPEPYPMGLFQADLWRGHYCSPEVQHRDLAFCSVPSSQDPELHYLTVTAAKAVFDLRTPNKPSRVRKYEIHKCE